LPFLRFTRDKRGYETTSLVHASGEPGRTQQRVLYWFRTPPGVKVGRPALDQDAIRSIEEQNPDIEFNWPRILEGLPAPASPTDDSRYRRARRDKPERRKPAPPTERPSPPRPVPAAQAASVEPPAAAVKVEPAGPERLARLRTRYAELLTRIGERGGSPEQIEALRARAESLNPDAWVTEEDAKAGIEQFELRIRDLRAALGIRRRRRSRRGRGTPTQTETPTEVQTPTGDTGGGESGEG